MNTIFRYVAFALTLLLLGASASNAAAQKPRKSRAQASRLGPDGVKKGEISQGNMDRKMLLDKQKAVASAKTSGGSYAGPVYAMPDNKYDTGQGRFSVGEYKNKAVPRGAKPKKSKRLIDQDNPDGRLYQQSVNRRDRKFLLF